MVARATRYGRVGSPPPERERPDPAADESCATARCPFRIVEPVNRHARRSAQPAAWLSMRWRRLQRSLRLARRRCSIESRRWPALTHRASLADTRFQRAGSRRLSRARPHRIAAQGEPCRSRPGSMAERPRTPSAVPCVWSTRRVGDSRRGRMGGGRGRVGPWKAATRCRWGARRSTAPHTVPAMRWLRTAAPPTSGGTTW